MLEYLVIVVPNDAQILQNRLDLLAQDGWRVVCDSRIGLILEREKRELENIVFHQYDVHYTFPDP